ncbi:MAG: Fic family protein [Magnetococcales bacterium]|nr:Fic family protein [Magnetococcales bacterium]
MSSFSARYLSRFVVPLRLVRTVATLAEYRGKQTLWAQTKPEVLKRLRQVAIIESVEASSRMENVEVGPHTFDRIVRHAADPATTDRSQSELAGYRDALTMIHQNAADMPPTENIVRQLHQTLMRYTPAGGGQYKQAANDIVEKDATGTISRIRLRTVTPALTATAMSALHDGFAAALEAGEIEPVLLIPLYIHDFLCIHPFPDGNGRVARLMTLLLLHRLGFDVGRYVSLERLIEESKATYYDSLALSDTDWAAGKHDHAPFTDYLLGVVLAAYRELERNTAVDLDHGARTRMVERAVESLPVQFRLAEVEKRCPLVGRDTIRSALTKMKHEGRIISEGRGRAATWRRLS